MNEIHCKRSVNFRIQTNKYIFKWFSFSHLKSSKCCCIHWNSKRWWNFPVHLWVVKDLNFNFSKLFFISSPTFFALPSVLVATTTERLHEETDINIKSWKMRTFVSRIMFSSWAHNNVTMRYFYKSVINLRECFDFKCYDKRSMMSLRLMMGTRRDDDVLRNSMFFFAVDAISGIMHRFSYSSSCSSRRLHHDG